MQIHTHEALWKNLLRTCDSTMSSHPAWKKFEERCAKRIGGRRRPVTGIDRGDGDSFNAMFELQCKLRDGIPDYLKAWLRDIVATATKRNRIGLVVWKERGRGRDDDDALVIMRWKDFVDLHGVAGLSVNRGAEELDADAARDA